jgi:VWFA-related protein
MGLHQEFEMRSYYLRIFLPAILVLLFCLPPGLPAQETQELKSINDKEKVPDFERDISVRLQLVDIIAVGSDGKFVTDLKREDFVLTVNGEQREIKTFDLFFPGARITPEGEEVRVVPTAATPPRSIVLFFDLAFSSYRGFRSAKKAAQEFVYRNLSPGDQVMILGFDRAIRVYQDFTTDRDKMVSAVEQIKYFFSSPSAGSDFISENQYNIRIYLQAMSKVALNLKALRGRKTIIMLSEGFDQRIALSYLSQYMKDTLDAFNNANATLFTVNVAGLEPVGTSPGVSLSRLRARQDTLSVLATETGGKFYHGSNDIESLLLSVDDDISNYYVLGFYVGEESDGRFREIEVRTVRPGVRLTYRKGFFSQKSFEKMDKDERLVHLKEGLYRNSPFSELAAAFNVSVFPRSDGGAVAGLVMQAPIEGTGAPSFELFGFVYSKEDKLIDAFHKTFVFKSRPQAETFRHVEHVSLEKGDNLIKLALRDNNTGKRAYYFVRARMPEIGTGLLASTVVLQEPGSGFAASSQASVRSFKNQLDVPDREPADPLLPLTRTGVLASVSSELQRGKEVGVILRVEGIDKTGGTPRLSAAYTLRGKDGTSYDLPEQDFRIFDVAGSKAAIVYSILDTSSVPAGEYVLRVRIDDASSGKVVGRQAEITLR